MKRYPRRFTRAGMLALGLSTAISALAFQIPSVAQVASTPHQALVRKASKELRPTLPFGVYDPHGGFRRETSVAIEHVFLPWQDVDVQSLHNADSYAAERGRDMLVTVEPWSWSPEKRISREALASGTIDGKFDGNIRNVCGTIGKLRSRVTIRWAHEMDDTSGRYTWSLWEPQDYIRAYRHFVDVCRSQAPNASYMWSPKGEKTLNAFYPGDEYVDVIGLSIFGLQEYDVDKFGRNRSFEEMLHASYDRVTAYKKPIYVAELGFVGDDQYLRSWSNSVASAGANFPDLKAILYFNEVETHPWPEDYGRPDWRIEPDLMK